MNPPIQGAVGVLCRDGRYLVIQRAAAVAAPLCWCFPGGTVEPGESITDAVVREMREEVGLTVTPIRQLYAWTHPKRRLCLTWWSLSEESQIPETPNPAEVAQTQWLTPNQMYQLTPMTPGNTAFLNALKNGQTILL